MTGTIPVTCPIRISTAWADFRVAGRGRPAAGVVRLWRLSYGMVELPDRRIRLLERHRVAAYSRRNEE